jgi:gamma-glutamyltranspeptidase
MVVPNVASIFLNHRLPFQPGDRLVQTQLASTRRAIGAGGIEGFYRDAIAVHWRTNY